MSPYDFSRVLVAIDGSAGAQKALDCALSLAAAMDCQVTALAVEGKLPAYAASIGEVDEVKREKDEYFRDGASGLRAVPPAPTLQPQTDTRPLPAERQDPKTRTARPHTTVGKPAAGGLDGGVALPVRSVPCGSTT